MTIDEAIKELEGSVKTLRELLATSSEEKKEQILDRLEATEIALDVMRKSEVNSY